jgi:hypothetical protein
MCLNRAVTSMSVTGMRHGSPWPLRIFTPLRLNRPATEPDDSVIGPQMTTQARRRRMSGSRRSLGTPAVVFVDDCGWNAFHQLAPQLRRAGVRTVRVSSEGLRKTRVASRLLFDRYETLRNRDDFQALRDILASENVVDIQFAESVSTLVSEATGVLAPTVAAQLGRRLAVIDKVMASRLFAQAGIRTPQAIPVSEVSPEEVAARFGFPLVVKGAIGYGGEGVSIVHGLGELMAATGAGAPDTLFYEQFIAGTKLDYAAAVGPAGIEQELTYRVSRWHQPVGRATEVETIEDPQLVAFGRRVLGVAGCTGLVNMDVIRDKQGVDWLIDFNARVFGGSSSFKAAGIDTSEGYLKAIGQRSAPPTRESALTGVRIRVFPTCLEDVIDTGSITCTTLAFLRESFPYLSWVGFRYWIAEALLTVDSLHDSRRAARAPVSLERSYPRPTAPTIPEVPTR